MIIVAGAAAGAWVWLGQRLPAPPPVTLAVAHVDLLAPPSTPPISSASAISVPPPSASPPDAMARETPVQAAAPEPSPLPVVVASLPPPPELAIAAAPTVSDVAPPVLTPPIVTPAAPVSVPVATSITQTVPPPAPPAVAPAASPVRPSFDIVRVTPQGDAVLAGRSAPGAKVTVTDNGRTIAEATSDSEGQWVALPSAPLPAGGQQLALASAAPSAAPVAGEAPLLVVVPAPPAAAQPGAASPAPTTALALLMPHDSAPRVLQGFPEPPSGHGGRQRLGLDVVDYDAHGQIRFGGTAAPGSTVRTYIDNHVAGDAKVDLDGHWSLSPSADVAVGTHRLRVDQLGTGPKVAARVELPFDRTSLAGLDLGEGRIVVQPRQTLWRIARHAYGQGVRYTVIFQANRDQIRDPNMIFPGKVFDVPSSPDPVAR